jgi:methylenetetrahydrofolate/methylenetetrahydromethanopterin dehydrogenase (NADP+)
VERRKILIQLDSDPLPSVFDRVVAIDAGADEVFSYGGVKPEQVRDLIHGAIFTRGPKDLNRTALFIGGSDVALGEKLLAAALAAMIPQFGLRVSAMLDANGANTTAAAAVRGAARHTDLASSAALVLGGTGPVGQRVALLLARLGAAVRLASRHPARAAAAADAIKARTTGAHVEPVRIASAEDLAKALEGRTVVVAAGAAGVVLLPKSARTACPGLKVAIDLNAVPPLGIEGVEVTDEAAQRDGVVCYGAVGVGGTKMKIHKAAVGRLFDRNDQVLDAEQIYALGQTL